MAACAPQRFLANNRNQAREAVLAASSVLPVSNSVLSLPTTRAGTAQVALSGAYSGPEEALYDVEIVDSTVETPLVSAPIFTGAGSGTLTDVLASALAQSFTVELSESGLPLLSAAIDFEGVTLQARQPGALGNAISIEVDQTPLTFTPQPYSLLHALAAGAGADGTPLRGSEFDFDTAVIGADGQIPLAAHRIAFGTDTSAIYLQYKQYKDGEWLYFFVPALKREVPAGAVVSFVTGGRTVTIAPGSPPETYSGIETLYDLLDQIKTSSALVDVVGIVANDRSPTGQAAHELVTRTDAHYEPSTGEGSESAAGFEAISVDPDAGTQLVIATCRAVSPADHPLAGVGRERWELKSSLLGELGTIVTDVPFIGEQFSLTVPTRLPFNFGDGLQKGNFTVTNIAYAGRAETDPTPPPICPQVGERAGWLGPGAVDQTLTLTYTKRPSGDCNCIGMTTPNLDTACLGNENITGGDSMGYQADTIVRLTAMRKWFTETVRSNSDLITVAGFDYATQDNYIASPTNVGAIAGTGANLLSLSQVVDKFESTLALIDPLPGGSPSLRADGCNAWDAALDELHADVALFDAHLTGFKTEQFPSTRYTARLGQVLSAAGISPLGEFEASAVKSGDGCWRDWGDAYYWTIVGSVGGAYAPAFTNHPCWLSRRADSDGAYYSTHEAAFQINVKDACIAALREGDTVTMSIGASTWPATYQVGDQLTLPIIGAAPIFLAGGQDASLVQNWYVSGSVSGPLPPLLFDPEAPAPYSAGSPFLLAFTLVPGGIPFAKGDRFAFSVEGAHYRWRVNAGAWHAAAAIPQANAALDSGLYIAFTPGAAPSFAAGDVFSFRVLQPWAVSNLRTPTVERWQWSGIFAYVIMDFGAEQTLDMAALALHTIPAGASITWQGGTAPGVYLWSETGVWQPGVIVTPFAAERLARYVKLSLAGAEGGGIGWLWVGQGLSTRLAANVALRPSYKVARGDGGLYQGGRFLGKSVSADIEWTEASLDEADAEQLVEMLDWIKAADDEPFVFVPQIERPADALLTRVVVDEVELPDIFSYQPKAGKERRLSAKLPTQGVWR